MCFDDQYKYFSWKLPDFCEKTQSIMNSCGVCQQDFDPKDEIIECQGFCKDYYHLSCIGLKRADKDFLRKSKNMQWHCDDCVGLKENKTFLKLTKMADSTIEDLFRRGLGNILAKLEKASDNNFEQIQSLNSTVGDQMKIVQDNCEQIKILNEKLANQGGKDVAKSAKRFRPDENEVPRKIINSKTDVIKGEKDINPVGVKVMPQPFWFHISPFHPSTTVDDIKTFVGENLKCDGNIQVHILVSRDTDVNSLRFVSFKVGIEEKWKNDAMTAANWPKGVRIREFVDLRTPNFRRVINIKKPLLQKNADVLTQPDLAMEVNAVQL